MFHCCESARRPNSNSTSILLPQHAVCDHICCFAGTCKRQLRDCDCLAALLQPVASTPRPSGPPILAISNKLLVLLPGIRSLSFYRSPVPLDRLRLCDGTLRSPCLKARHSCHTSPLLCDGTSLLFCVACNGWWWGARKNICGPIWYDQSSRMGGYGPKGKTWSLKDPHLTLNSCAYEFKAYQRICLLVPATAVADNQLSVSPRTCICKSGSLLALLSATAVSSPLPQLGSAYQWFSLSTSVSRASPSDQTIAHSSEFPFPPCQRDPRLRSFSVHGMLMTRADRFENNRSPARQSVRLSVRPHGLPKFESMFVEKHNWKHLYCNNHNCKSCR